MLRQIFYEVKKFYRDKEGAFFGILFPIGFALIYILAFSNLLSQDTSFDPIPVGISIENHAQEIKPLLDHVGIEGHLDDQVLKLTDSENKKEAVIHYLMVDANQGQEILKNNTVKHLVTLGKNSGKFYGKITTLPNEIKSLETNIVYNVFDSLLGIQDVVMTTIEEEKMNPLALMSLKSVFKDSQSLDEITQEENSEGTSGFSVFFYACLGYLCLYFMSSGLQVVIVNEANYSNQALRLQNAPMTKRRRIFFSFIPIFVTSLFLIYIVLFMFIVANIPLGHQIGHIVLLLTEGVLVGILSGMCLATYIRVSPEKLNGIVTAVSLILGSFAGLMAPPLTQLIRENIPWVNRINPIGLVSEGIYFLNNYPTNYQYWINVGILLVWIFILVLLLWFGTKGDSYESL